MSYNGTINTGILGYGIYDTGKMIKENSLSTDCSYLYRQIDGITYFEDKKCRKWYQECIDECKNCIQLNTIQDDIFKKDPGIEKIFKSEYDDCVVIIRTPLKLESSFILDYCIDGLVIVS